MNDNEIEEMLKELDMPYSYYNFQEEDITPPFIAYVEEQSSPVLADGSVYFMIRNIRFELYSDVKDYTLINKVKEMFDKRCIRYKCKEDWFYNDRMFEFSFQVQL